MDDILLSVKITEYGKVLNYPIEKPFFHFNYFRKLPNNSWVF